MRQLVFVVARLRRDGKSDGRRRQFDGVVNNRVGFVAERVSGRRLAQLGDGDNVAGVRFGNLFERLALHDVQRPQPLLRILRAVVDGGVRLNRAGENFKDVDATGERIGNGLEDES